MVWLGLPEPPAWQLVLYFLCIGMFGVGVSMLYTPIVVDRMQLMFPSGFAVANILRALTDRSLLKRSIAKLGGGMGVGYLFGVSMQQDRSTGWRLGTNRLLQFRYQVIGIAMGAVLAVVLAKLFMSAYPILTQNQFTNPHLPGSEKWQSAMTFKFVGALKGVTKSQPQVLQALQLGIALGLIIEIVRKLIKSRPAYKQFVAGSRVGRAADFLLDAVFLPRSYSFSIGVFVELPTVLCWAAGGVAAGLYDGLTRRLVSSKAAKRSKIDSANLPGACVTSAAEGLPPGSKIIKSQIRISWPLVF